MKHIQPSWRLINAIVIFILVSTIIIYYFRSLGYYEEALFLSIGCGIAIVVGFFRYLHLRKKSLH